MQTVKMEMADGGFRTLELPDLTPEKLKKLSEALERLRATCNLSPRKYQGSHAEIAHKLEEFLPLGVQARNLHDRDIRAEIVALPDQLFFRVIDLAYNVTNDAGSALEQLGQVVKGFGLVS
jgi:hypothetical protein